MFGTTIHKGPMDWEIFQHMHGSCNIRLSGEFSAPQAAIEKGIRSVEPIIRVVTENDNSDIISWRKVDAFALSNTHSGDWFTTLTLPKGGLYRIETALKIISQHEHTSWIFRGDLRHHIGVGNLFIIAGQASAAGYGQGNFPDLPELGVHVYRNRETWDLASHPLDDSTGMSDDLKNIELGQAGTSPYIHFAKRFKELTHLPVGLIPTALGGSSIFRWSAKGDLYANMLYRIRLLGSSFAGILWYQGKADATPDRSYLYYDAFVDFVDNIHTDLEHDLPIFTFQLNRQLDTTFDDDWGLLRESQRQAALHLPYTYILPTLDVSLSDTLHNSSAANVILGERLARQCQSIFFDKQPYNSPNPTTLELVGANELIVTFSHAEHGFLLSGLHQGSNGFTIHSSSGPISIEYINICSPSQNSVTIHADKPLNQNVTLSYLWRSNPEMPILLEKSTHLPPLAFYRLPITNR